MSQKRILFVCVHNYLLIVGLICFCFLFVPQVVRGQDPAAAANQIRPQGSKAGERQVLTIKGVEYAFRWCPAGTFMMGSPESEQDRDDDETQHKVTLTKGFWMLETEVTQEMWLSVMGSNPSLFKGHKRLPVEQVSWSDSQEYIQKLNGMGFVPPGFRFALPTESQWEYACRAGTTTPFHFGSALNGDKANCDGNEPYGTETNGTFLEKTVVVGSYPANAWGLYDMHGNVCELCNDWRGDYPRENAVDPVGASTGTDRIFRGADGIFRGTDRIFRGGCWSFHAQNCRTARRNYSKPSDRFARLGLRLAMVSDETTNVSSSEHSQDKKEVVEVFRQLAEQGNAAPQYSLGRAYFNGDGVSQNKTEAAKWFRKAADQGHAQAQFLLGACYFNGEGVSQDQAEAVKWWHKAADQELAEAQISLGVYYVDEAGVLKDQTEAAKWFRKAAEQGHAEAQFFLGSCYFDGEGVAQDQAEAVKWLRKAAVQGYANAIKVLKLLGQ